MPLDNSYCWYAKPHPTFLEELMAILRSEFALPSMMIPDESPIHVTLGLAAGKETDLNKQIDIFQEVRKQTQQLVSNHWFVKRSIIMMLPCDIFISQHGLVCIEYAPCLDDDEGSIKAIHNNILKMAKEHKLSSQKKYSGDNFRPHLAVGQICVINFKNGEYITESEFKKEFEKRITTANHYLNDNNHENKLRLLNILSARMRLLNISNVSLEYHRLEYDSTHTKLCDEFLFGRRDYEVVDVIPHPNPTMAQDKSQIIFRDREKAIGCVTFLYQFGPLTLARPTKACDLVQEGDNAQVFRVDIDNHQLDRVKDFVKNVAGIPKRS